ncbi:MAG TPA: sodium-independent anion transporter [Thermoanaerobaculia bacterium]
MRHVPAIDAAGMHALEQMAKKCRHQRITMILCEIRPHPLNAIVRAGKLEARSAAVTRRRRRWRWRSVTPTTSSPTSRRRGCRGGSSKRVAYDQRITNVQLASPAHWQLLSVTITLRPPWIRSASS